MIQLFTTPVRYKMAALAGQFQMKFVYIKCVFFILRS